MTTVTRDSLKTAITSLLHRGDFRSAVEGIEALVISGAEEFAAASLPPPIAAILGVAEPVVSQAATTLTDDALTGAPAPDLAAIVERAVAAALAAKS